MDTEQIVEELEEVARQLDITVRRERGSFQGGHCHMGGEPYIILNKRHPPEAHLAHLADGLQHYPVDTVYLKPAVRAALEDAWQRASSELEEANA